MRIDRIKLVCELARRDMRVKDLAEKAGITRNTVTAIKNGKSCSVATATAIAQALGVTLDELKED
jgi:putative transcriptional regulator